MLRCHCSSYSLQMPSEICETQGPLASLLFRISITSTFHIWTCTRHLPGLAVSCSLVLIFLFFSLPQATSGLVSPCIMDPILCASNRQKARKLGWCRLVLVLWSSHLPFCSPCRYIPMHALLHYSPALLRLLSLPNHFPHRTIFNDITDSKYYAQMIQLTFQSITITKQKFKPHISCTVVIDIHSHQ